MKIVGLMITKNEVDIIERVLAHCGWLDELYVIDNGSTDGTYEILLNHPKVTDLKRYDGEFDESTLVPMLLDLARFSDADWFVDIDADEIYPSNMREVMAHCPKCFNIVAVTVNYLIGPRCYRQHLEWPRIYRNDPTLFDFSHLKKLHGGKIPIRKIYRRTYSSGVSIDHYQLRSYEQAMAKYENYKRLDPKNDFQGSYEHLKAVAEMFKTGDFTGLIFFEP